MNELEKIRKRHEQISKEDCITNTAMINLARIQFEDIEFLLKELDKYKRIEFVKLRVDVKLSDVLNALKEGD